MAFRRIELNSPEPHSKFATVRFSSPPHIVPKSTSKTPPKTTQPEILMGASLWTETRDEAKRVRFERNEREEFEEMRIAPPIEMGVEKEKFPSRNTKGIVELKVELKIGEEEADGRMVQVPCGEQVKSGGGEVKSWRREKRRISTWPVASPDAPVSPRYPRSGMEKQI